jgi:hypothetical protein
MDPLGQLAHALECSAREQVTPRRRGTAEAIQAPIRSPHDHGFRCCYLGARWRDGFLDWPGNSILDWPGNSSGSGAPVRTRLLLPGS